MCACVWGCYSQCEDLGRRGQTMVVQILSGMGQWGHSMEKSRWEVISSHRQAPGEATPQTKTDSITDFNSLLVCLFLFFCFFFSCVSIFFQVLSGSASLLKWFGATTLLLLSSFWLQKSHFVASSRHVLESERPKACQAQTWTHLFLENQCYIYFYSFSVFFHGSGILAHAATRFSVEQISP